MHEYTVEFRIHGKNLDVTSVTDALGLEPCLVRHVGEHRSDTEQWQEGLWSYNGFPASAGSKSWSSLEEGLGFVLERLWPLSERIEAYKRQYKVILWCGHFQSSNNETTVLSPLFLKTLGDFGVELFIDSYLSEAQA